MPRVTEAEQTSRVRMSTLEGEIFRLLAKQVEADPDYTYEEITLALLNVASRQVGHLWRAQFDDEETP